MKDVKKNDISEEIFENEILVNELIEYMVDELFPKFSEFCALYKSNDEIKEILKKRIVSIERRKENHTERKTKNSPAEYSPSNKKIIFYSDSPITINDIKKSYKWKNSFTHECVHAATDTSKNKKYYQIGCASSGKKNKIIILKELFFNLGTQPGKNIIEKVRNMCCRLSYMLSFNLGDAMNEGLTTWITEKMVPKTETNIYSYPWEKNFIDSLEEVLGTKQTLELIKCDYKDIARKLNISKLDSIFLLRYMDIASSLSDVVFDENQKVKNLEEYERIIETYYSFGGVAQNIFIENCFIPMSDKKFAYSMRNGDMSVYDLINLYNTMQNFKEIICVKDHKIEDVLDPSTYSLYYGNTFELFERYVKDVFIVFSNCTDVSGYTEIDIMNTKGIYDCLFKNAKDKQEINSQFYKYITEEEKKIINRQTVVNTMKGSKIFVKGSPCIEGISLKDLAGNVAKNQGIGTSDIALSRKQRRALERKNKKDMQKRGNSQRDCENLNK